MKRIGLLLLTLTSAFAQPAPLAFEVASIRPTVLPKGTYGFSSGPAGIKISGNRVTATLATVPGLLMYAYGVQDFQVLGLPTESGHDFYDLAAKTPDDTATLEQVRQMIQGLLADRFRLKLHREMKDLPVYGLVVGKNGPKFKASDPDEKSSVSVTQGPVSRMVFSNKPISELVRLLNLGLADRPVVDKTGLKASYDFALEFSRGSTNGDAADPTGISIFTAVQEQLGLKLDPAKDPMEVFVVDHVDKNPSLN